MTPISHQLSAQQYTTLAGVLQATQNARTALEQAEYTEQLVLSLLFEQFRIPRGVVADVDHVNRCLLEPVSPAGPPTPT